MKVCAETGQTVAGVEPGSPARRAGICAGDALLAVNGEAVLDVIDYEFLTAEERLTLTVRRADGKTYELTVRKESYEPLGLNFGTSLMSPVRQCKNRCVFCFVDQMPKGVRTSLSFKDDDWRLSFIMGNYITLTNVSEAEFSRMRRRRVSPLYVSVHATDGEVRARMMGNPSAAGILERLRALSDDQLRFHAQIVLCPGWNDGETLKRSLSDLAALYPAAQSVAVVPVGLTKFREGLAPLRCFTREEAQRIILEMSAFQDECRQSIGTRFAFLSDEWYSLAERPLPPYEAYEEFPQIENGVGLVRLFERDALDTLMERTPLGEERRFLFGGGVAATPYFKALLEKLSLYNVQIREKAIVNDFFGARITVAGLVTGQDLVSAFLGERFSDTLIIPRNMLKEDADVFLDDMTLSEAEEKLSMHILPVRSGTEFIETVLTE